MPDQHLTVQAKKYDGRVRKTWTGGVLSRSDDAIVLIAKFDETVEHNDLGCIKAGTISFEHFWFERWYNVFRFHDPEGKLIAHYCNIAMPAILADDILSYVDLDIDVIRWPDGRVDVLDRDDFDENRIKFGYTPEIVEKAEWSLEELLKIVEAGELP